MENAIRRVLLLIVAGVFLSSDHSQGAAEDADETQASSGSALTWHTDYASAKSLACKSQKMLFLCFHDAARDGEFRAFRDRLLVDREIADRLSSQCVIVSLPVDERVRADDQDVALLEHEAFREMHGRAGIALLDFRDDTLPHYGQVVSVLPLGKDGAKYRARSSDAADSRWVLPRREILALLDLPPGSLTQRTLIFAVRTHVDRPASADGEFHPILAAETASHSSHQARIRVQGHHAWEQRFHAINAQLADGSRASEVCAESWSGQSLLEAARECVHSWRQSSGHWNAVRARHRAFGYDMKLGANGVWYATGIFARSGP